MALGVMVAAMAVHNLWFGHVVRCGAGLPVVFVVSYLIGLGHDRRRGWPVLALAGAFSALVLVRDTAAGPEILPVVLAVQGVLWAVGQVARNRAELADQLRARTRELQALRDERAALDVADDRARMSLELESLLDERLARLEAAAVSADAGAAGVAVLAGLEADSRRTLEDMRRVVGSLRGGEPALAPTPSVAHVEGLLARRGSVRLSVDGDPRTLPPSLELSAYRIVEHLVGVLEDDPDAAVTLGFSDDALEVRVAGRVPRGADVRGAVARARERARLHAGSLDARVFRGRARIVATLPTSVPSAIG
jgi:signal transduction histidine kinase